MREAALKLEEENARKAVEEQQKQEKERLAKEKATAAAAAAAAAAPPAPKVTASVQKEETGENSPRAEFERWTAKMIVRRFCLSAPAACLRPFCARKADMSPVHQDRHPPRGLVQPLLP